MLLSYFPVFGVPINVILAFLSGKGLDNVLNIIFQWGSFAPWNLGPLFGI
jgi:hypothetical protein